MRARYVSLLGASGIAIVIAAVSAVPLVGQGSPTAARTARSSVARTPDGHPDLQGMYNIAWVTPLERPAGAEPTLSNQEAAQLERRVAQRIETGARPSRGDREAPPIGGDGSPGAAGNVGGYNNFWIDSGTQYFKINGSYRSSIIVAPPDGRIPALTAAAQQRIGARGALAGRPTSDQQESQDPGLEAAPAAYDDPERRPLGERCLMGFGSTSGPPALPVLYNNLHQIVQTPEHVVILNEMVHDTRVIRMNAQHLPPSVRRWMGDSVARWEGDTLVVDTTNFTEKTRFRGATADLHVVERFSRLDDRSLLYRFTVEDPATWTRPWTGEYVWPATDEHLYEYACHEANYALGDILSGARQREQAAKNTSRK